jgi:cyanophycinase
MKLRFARILILLYFIPFISKAQPPHVPVGTLFIIGGGDISDTLRWEMLSAAKWKKGDLIAVVTLASNWDSSFIRINEAFSHLTGSNCLHIDSVALHRPSAMDSLGRASLIYLGGGDQALFMSRIKGTSFQAQMRNLYANGRTIAGTSAGASVMSRMMLTGNSNRDDGSSTSLKGLWTGSVEFAEGLSLLDSVIIDQHFVVRSRYNRMFTSIMDHPGYQYVAINESTAIVVSGNSATVLGANQVIVADPPAGIKRTVQGELGASGICLAIYLPGDTFIIRR